MLKFRDITNPGEAIVRQVAFDESSKKTVLKSFQPGIDDILAMNRAFLNADRCSSALMPGDAPVLVARVPLWLIEKWWIEEKLNYFDPEHTPRLLRRFNSNEYSDLRTAPGNL